jgi:hypothetical protein
MNTTKKALVLLALLAGACKVEQRSSVIVRGRAMPELNDTGCSFQPDGEFNMSGGILDLADEYAGAIGYELPIYVENQLKIPAPPATEDAKNWAASAARVRVNPSDYLDEFRPDPLLLPFSGGNTIPMTTQEVEAEGGRTAVLAKVISHAVGTELRNAALLVPEMGAVDTDGDGVADAAPRGTFGERRTIVLGISLQGHTKDGEFLETNEWYYPVEVCFGCLESPGGCPVGFVETFRSCHDLGQDVAPFCVEAP